MATLDQAIAQMLGQGMPPFPSGAPIVGAGRIIRYGPKKRAWYVLHEYTTRAGARVISGAFGVWGRLDATRIEIDWGGVSSEERARIEAQRGEAEERERARRQERARNAANRARQQWRAAQEDGCSPYLELKGVEPEKALRFFSDGTLVVPMLRFDTHTLVGLQKISPDGTKRFNRHMAKEGAACRLGPEPKDGEPVIIAEGVATALSIRMAIKRRVPVYIAFDCGNLAPAARIVRQLVPASPIIFAADDDFATEGNPGTTKALAAVKEIGNACVAVPVFRTRTVDSRWTDFNDLHQAEGIEAVARSIEAALSMPAGPAASSPDDPTQARVPWRDLLLRRGEERRLVDCRENVFLFLEHHPAWKGVVRLDEFANKVVKLRPPPFDGGAVGEWDRADTFRLGLWLAQQERLIVRSYDSLNQAVNATATMHPYHPVRSWLDGLTWDGTPRLEMWIEDALNADPAKREYHALAGRYWMMGMIARIYEPGCIMRSMLILEGEQQRGKSTALAILGGEWYSETPFVIGDKDAYQSLRGKMLYEIAELDAFNRAEATKVKAFVSARVDNYRASYDDRSRDWPRQVVFAATTNQDEYFKDSTGNTRFWPVRVGELDLDVLRSMREQLFAEAVHRYKAGERRYPTPDEERRLFRPEQDAREIADPWEAMIASWLHSSTVTTVTQGEIFAQLDIKPDRIDNAKQMSTRIGIVMKRVGWMKKRRATGLREYYYERPAAERLSAPRNDDEQPF